VEPHHLDSVGEALLHALASTLGAAFTPALHEAWASAALVASVMQRALIRAWLRASSPRATSLARPH
jgi:hemoglobin-like flavoprotein